MNQALAVVIASALTSFSALASAGSLCGSQERTLFTCKSKSKLASICASQTLSENAGYLRYVYGNDKKIELDYPKNRSLAKENFLWSKSWSPGVNVYLKFRVGQFKYYVYSGQGESYGDRENPNSIYHWEYSGIAVFRNEALLQNIKCADANISTSEGINEIERTKIPSDDEANFNLLSKLPPP